MVSTIVDKVTGEGRACRALGAEHVSARQCVGIRRRSNEVGSVPRRCRGGQVDICRPNRSPTPPASTEARPPSRADPSSMEFAEAPPYDVTPLHADRCRRRARRAPLERILERVQ